MIDFIKHYLIAPFEKHFSVEGRLFWVYLLVTLLIVVGVYFLRDRKPGVLTLKTIWQYVFPPRIYRNHSTRIDLLFFVVDTLAQKLLVVPLLISAVTLGTYFERGLLFVFGVYSNPVSPGVFGPVILTVLYVIAFDFGFYVGHRLMHKVGLLWEFHKIHHSAEVLNPLTLYREHPLDQVVIGACMALSSGVVFAVFDYFTATTVQFVEAVWVIGLLFFVAGGHLRHMEVWVSYGAVLNRVFISPAHHQIHHSIAVEHLDRNFGGIFSVWDWLFASLYVPVKKQSLTLGLNDGAHRDYDSVFKLYHLPVLNLYRKAVAKLRRLI